MESHNRINLTKWFDIIRSEIKRHNTRSDSENSYLKQSKWSITKISYWSVNNCTNCEVNQFSSFEKDQYNNLTKSKINLPRARIPVLLPDP